MDDVPGRQVEAGRGAGLAGGAAHAGAHLGQRAARRQQPRSGSAMNGAVDAAAAEQRRVGGIDDGIHRQRGDVGPHRLDGGHGFPATSAADFPARGFVIL
jgi:hypothetical protein